MAIVSELFSLAGKNALVTGATGHLGQSMAFSLAEAGARVFVNARSEKACGRLVDRLIESGLEAESAVFDVTKIDQIEQFFRATSIRDIHVLVNNAYQGGAGGIEMNSSEAYALSYEITVEAAHNITRAALPWLRASVSKTGDASVVSISSMYGMRSPDKRVYDSEASVNPPFYGAAKAALIQWSRYAACEFGAEGIRFNSISPGPFPSDTVRANSFEMVERLAARVPLGRVGMSAELKGPILFLASPASSFVTGANLVVDGGWTSW